LRNGKKKEANDCWSKEAKMEKVLIIKTGYSEVLDNNYHSRKTSYGDILRTTPILHLYKNDDVTWMTDELAFPLLEGITYIKRLIPLDFTTAMDLLDEDFDTVINLEKSKDICKLASKIEAWKKYGFRFDKKTGQPQAYDRALDVLTVSSNHEAKKENQKYVQELLFEMVGAKWNREGYLIGYKPKSDIQFDIALNTLIGDKWPTKAWPMENWDDLENVLEKEGFSVSRQDKQGDDIKKDMKGYIDWINSSRYLVSNDSLGMHIGIALGKKVIGLFGPTSDKEVYFYENGKALLPEPVPPCMPCFSPKCDNAEICIKGITPERILNEIKTI
jgi:heptosyltransferase II